MNILIVGATSGIGHSLWKYYSGMGNRIAIIGRRKNILESMEAESDGSSRGYECDIASIDAFDSVYKSIIDYLGEIDLAIVCAGTGEINKDLNKERELSTLDVNVMGWTNAVDSIFNRFVEQGHGHLVAITSVGGMQPSGDAPAYSASKAFQINYTRSLQKKSKDTGVVVTEIRPGLVQTRMAKGEGLFWVMPLEKVTRQILRAVGCRRRLAVVTRRWRIVNYLLKHI